jgi:hypothetical protein
MDDSLIGRLFGRKSAADKAPPVAEQAVATLPEPEEELAVCPADDDAPPTQATPGRDEDPKLSLLLQRIQQLTASESAAGEAAMAPPVVWEEADRTEESPENAPVIASPDRISDGFLPVEPASIAAAGLSESEVEGLVLKYLLAKGDASGRDVAEQTRLPFVVLDALMRQMKYEQLLVYRGTSAMNDYIYQLTDLGRERARRLAEYCSYYGAAPVPLADYIGGVAAQSLTTQHPTCDDLQRAFEDLLINKRMLTRLGPAINSGRGMFLFGAPGNGKTSIAERVTRAFGQYIWIPRAIGIDGEIIRLFDPTSHEEAPLPANTALWDGAQIDKRWIRIRRPTIVVGGELTMDNLEVTINTSTGISEAPVQLKSNCGTLVIDDFGRQKMSVDQLLNRWIVPLEKRYDFLNLPNGKKIQVPFDQLIVFSTNLEPKDLVDDAFLRRIPYKIEVSDPSEAEFRDLFRLMCPKLGFEHEEQAIDYLIETHYKAIGRPFRCCQPRDLLQQVKNHCLYQKLPPVLSREYFDIAVDNYFAIM